MPFLPQRAEAASSSKELSAAAPDQQKRKTPQRDDELIVRFRQDATEQKKDGAASASGAQRSGKLRGWSRAERLKLPKGADPDAVAAQLRMNPAVEIAEPNYLIKGAELIPNDGRFPEQWALKNNGQTGGQTGSDINAPAAWETTTGSPSTIIAVIDSGIDFLHPDLQNNRWINPSEQANGIDDDGNGLVDDISGWDFVANEGDASDEQGHGTQMAGAIAAEGNNGAGITGVMWRASLMNLRVLNNTGTGDLAQAVQAIDYAISRALLSLTARGVRMASLLFCVKHLIEQDSGM